MTRQLVIVHTSHIAFDGDVTDEQIADEAQRYIDATNDMHGYKHVDDWASPEMDLLCNMRRTAALKYDLRDDKKVRPEHIADVKSSIIVMLKEVSNADL